MKSSLLHRKISFVLVFCLLISGCARNQQIVRMSADEKELGNAIHQQILQTVPVYQEPALNHYVQDVGHKIVSHAGRKELSYRFIVLEDVRIYSTFAPGGYVYITTGFFQFLQSEIELAGVLAYEIAALQYKDPRLSRLKKSFDFLLKTGTYAAPAFGTIGVLSVLGLVLIGAATSGEKSDLAKVEQADKRALLYLFQSGYDPQGLINPLYRMGNLRSPHRAYLYDYIQSHPVDIVRLNKLNALFEKLPLDNKSFDAGRESFLAKTQVVRSAFARK